MEYTWFEYNFDLFIYNFTGVTLILKLKFYSSTVIRTK